MMISSMCMLRTNFQKSLLKLSPLNAKKITNKCLSFNLTTKPVINNYITQRTINEFRRTNIIALTSNLSYRSFSTKNDSSDEEVLDEVNQGTPFSSGSILPATVAIPEIWPNLPVIATRRNPVFPRFMKILEVNM